MDTSKKELLIKMVEEECKNLSTIVFDVSNMNDEEITIIQTSEKAVCFVTDYAIRSKDITEEEAYEIRKIFYDKYSFVFEL